ncbi:hypothetical protein EV2_026160 [Malus domestica]
MSLSTRTPPRPSTTSATYPSSPAKPNPRGTSSIERDRFVDNLFFAKVFMEYGVGLFAKKKRSLRRKGSCMSGVIINSPS